MKFNIFRVRKEIADTKQPAPVDVIEQYEEMVNTVLCEHGVDLSQSYIPDEKKWVIKADCCRVFLRLIRMENEEIKEKADFIEVYAPLLPLPSENLLAVYRFLLEVNGTSVGAALGVDHGHIYARTMRSVNGLNEVGIDAMIRAVICLAERALEVIRKQFRVGALWT